MSSSVTITSSFVLENAARGRKVPAREPRVTETPPGRVPRVARLMALALLCEEWLHKGEVESFAEIARLSLVTRARVTQVMNLLNLSPQIQMDILLLPSIESGRDPIKLKDLQPIAREPGWDRQITMWRLLTAQSK